MINVEPGEHYTGPSKHPIVTTRAAWSVTMWCCTPAVSANVLPQTQQLLTKSSIYYNSPELQHEVNGPIVLLSSLFSKCAQFQFIKHLTLGRREGD